jgi:hypothetical protein
VPGLSWRGDAAIPPPRPARVRFADRPAPDFSGIELGRYRRGPSSALRAAIATMRPDAGAEPFPEILYLPAYFVAGCSGRCVFCSWGTHLDINEPERAAEELVTLAERHGTDCFYS